VPNRSIPTTAVPSVTWHARHIRGQLLRHGWTLEDIEQHLASVLIKALDHYDASRGASLRTFADRVMTNAGKMLIRHAHAKKRLTMALPSPPCPALAPETRLAVREAHATLPDELRRVCEALVTGTPTEAAQDLGLTRQQVYRRRDLVRAHFEAHGLGGGRDGESTLSNQHGCS
jgi:DNA-directed RNA polymerase specialized sigma24 family protein